MEKIIYELINNHPVCYKFSKSSETYTSLFQENHYISYPEFSVIQTNSQTKLSFITDVDKLLYVIVYGDQLTQIVFDKRHPFSEYLSISNIEYINPFWSEYHSNIVLTGYNISMKNPCILKEIIRCGTTNSIINLFTNDRHNLSIIYRELKFFETAQFFIEAKKLFFQNGCRVDFLKAHLNDITIEKSNIFSVNYSDFYKSE